MAEKFKQMLSARKLMATVFWYRKGVLKCIAKHLKRKLRRVIQNKRRGMLTSGAVFLHDNARPHTTLALEHCWSI
jgi:hypothetical protein